MWKSFWSRLDRYPVHPLSKFPVTLKEIFLEHVRAN